MSWRKILNLLALLTVFGSGLLIYFWHYWQGVDLAHPQDAVRPVAFPEFTPPDLFMPPVASRSVEILWPEGKSDS